MKFWNSLSTITFFTTLIMIGAEVKAQNFNNFLIQPSVYSFKLDKDQILTSAFMDFDNEKNELWRSVKFPAAAIEIFDASTGILKRKIIPKTGSCNVFKRLSNGNIWIQQEDGYALMDSKGNIIETRKEPAVGGPGVDLITGNSSFNPISIFDNDLLVTGYMIILQHKNYDLANYLKHGVVRSIGPAGKITYRGRTPVQYRNNFYGGLNRYCSTEVNGKLIVGAFYANSIQIIDLKKKNVTFRNVPTKYDRMIKPMSDLKNYVNFSNAEAGSHFTESFSLIGIVYDKYRHVYYRFVRHPGNSLPIKCSLIIMNENFETLFENIIPQVYDPARFFINKKGLFFANNKVYQQNSNMLTFDLFTLTRKK